MSHVSFTTPSGKPRVLRAIATSTRSGESVEITRLVAVPATREACRMLPK